MKGATPANADNLSTTGRQPASAVEERTVFMTRLEVETMLGREKEKASVSSTCLNLKPPYVAEVVMEPYSVGYVTPQFRNLTV